VKPPDRGTRPVENSTEPVPKEFAPNLGTLKIERGTVKVGKSHVFSQTGLASTEVLQKTAHEGGPPQPTSHTLATDSCERSSCL